MKSIQLKETFSIPISKMWNLWTTHEGLKQFFGADNNVELKVGGSFEIYFILENPNGLKGSEGCKVLSFLPEKMISFSWNAPPHLPEVRNHEHKCHVVIEFIEEENDGTTLVLNHLGWLEGKEWDETFDYFNKAWPYIMENLKKTQ